MGVEPPTPPNFFALDRAPLVKDYKEFDIGDIWSEQGTQNLWLLTAKKTGAATWTQINQGGSAVLDDLTVNNGDVTITNGGLVIEIINYASTLRTLADGTVYGLPDGDDLEVYMGSTGGLSTFGKLDSAGGTVTITRTINGINFEAAGGAAANTYTADDGNAAAPNAAGNVVMHGGANLDSSAGGNTVTYDLIPNITVATVTTTGNVVVGGDIAVAGDIIALRELKSYLSINTQVGIAYTLQLTDDSKEIQFTNGAAVTVTIPTKTAIPLPIGTQIILVQYGLGTVTVVADAGVTLDSVGHKVATYEQYSAVVLIKQDDVGEGTWLLAGDLA